MRIKMSNNGSLKQLTLHPSGYSPALKNKYSGKPKNIGISFNQIGDP